MKQIFIFLKSAFLTAFVFCVIAIGAYCMIKVDNAAGYASYQTDERVNSENQYVISLFNRNFTITPEEIKEGVEYTLGLLAFTL